MSSRCFFPSLPLFFPCLFPYLFYFSLFFPWLSTFRFLRSIRNGNRIHFLKKVLILMVTYPGFSPEGLLGFSSGSEGKDPYPVDLNPEPKLCRKTNVLAGCRREGGPRRRRANWSSWRSGSRTGTTGSSFLCNQYVQRIMVNYWMLIRKHCARVKCNRNNIICDELGPDQNECLEDINT